MKKILIVGAIITILIAGISIVTADPPGPAPDYGDGNSDGTGSDSPYGPNDGPGSAPNAGDGISDGPGWYPEP